MARGIAPFSVPLTALRGRSFDWTVVSVLREMVIERTDVLMLLVVGGLLGFLVVSTLVWALQAARGIGQEGAAADSLLRARLWAAAVPLAVVLVLVVASVVALFSPGESGGVRLLEALGSMLVRLGLVVCAVAALAPGYLCVRAWLKGDWRFGERLHYSIFVAALFLTLGLLFAMGLSGG